MEALELCLLLLAAVLASSVVSQFFPKLSTPLVQIGFGLVIAAFGAGNVQVTLDPELFLVLFIAPLLYDEAREADLAGLWRHRMSVLAYAVGLVLVIVLCVGFALKLAAPSLSLAAAFALGAALGPTDAVAVASVSRTTNINDNVKSILKGEALLNDASGLVSFQFAVAAVTTGAFSVVDAGIEFAFSFFGGLLLGAVFGVVANAAIAKIRDVGYEDTTFNVLFEVFTPFIVFLAAEAVGVSGVITVVVCGIVNASTRRTNGPSLSRTSLVSSGVWKVLSFALNGVVFVLLGTQLPSAFLAAQAGFDISLAAAVALVALITVILEVARFAWSVLAVLLEKPRGERRLGREDVLDALVLTLSGAKGTITLSIMFTLPYTFADASGAVSAFPDRSLLIFLASGVIVCTLLIATFVVPLLAPKPKVGRSEAERAERNLEAGLDVLRCVIEELTDRQTRETSAATGQVVAAYNDRIERVKSRHDIDESTSCVELRLRVLGWMRGFVKEARAGGEVDEDVAEAVLDQLRTVERLARHEGLGAEAGQYAFRIARAVRSFVHRVLRHLPVVDPSEEAVARRALLRDAYLYVIRRLEDLMVGDEDVNAEDVAAVLLDYRNLLRGVSEKMPSISTISATSDKADEIEALALRLELKYIQQMVDEERMTRPYARRMRENVAMMQVDLGGTL